LDWRVEQETELLLPHTSSPQDLAEDTHGNHRTICQQPAEEVQ
jgi:hypothetical protein